MVPDIRKARKEIGWTQQDLANAVGCSVTHISHLENNRAVASVDLYERIAMECDVELVIYFTDLE